MTFPEALQLLTTLPHFGTELNLEAFLPPDAATAAVLHRLTS